MSKPLQYESEQNFGSGELKDAEEFYRDTNSSYVESEQTKYNGMEDDENNIIPWKKLLRKTNSRLNLIS